MHEAGIAADILEIASTAASERGSGFQVRTVRVRVGAFTGVACEALEFAFECLRPPTACSEAVLEIERVPLAGECGNCGWNGSPSEDCFLLCPRCFSALRVVSGRELEVASIDLEERPQEL